jgi:hypothetical protein
MGSAPRRKFRRGGLGSGGSPLLLGHRLVADDVLAEHTSVRRCSMPSRPSETVVRIWSLWDQGKPPKIQVNHNEEEPHRSLLGPLCPRFVIVADPLDTSFRNKVHYLARRVRRSTIDPFGVSARSHHPQRPTPEANSAGRPRASRW